jgi:malonyl-CoA O-methyltransferase
MRPASAGHADWSRLVRANFARAAADYERNARLQALVGERLGERLDCFRIAPRRALDLGCGTGAGSRALRARFPGLEIVQLDLALDMLLRCRPPAWLRPFRRRLLLCADAAALPIAPQSVDLAHSNLMLQWCREPQRVFAEVRRVLRPGGVLLFSTFGPDTLRELRDSWAAVDDGAHVNRFEDMHDLGDALLAAGLSEPVMEAEFVTQSYADLHALLRDLKAIGAGNADPLRRRSLTGKGRWQALQKAYRRYLTPDGRCPATFEVIYGHAWRAATERAGADGAIAVPLSAIGRVARKPS